MPVDTISQGNKLIAEFMEWKPSVVGDGINLYYLPNDTTGEYNHSCKQMSLEGMKYHTSWDWLMSVVEKIEEFKAFVTIEKTVCVIETKGYYKQTYDGTKIKATYFAVIAFIEWYNTQNKQ